MGAMDKTISNKKYLRLIAWLRETRIQKKMSVRELGELLGVSNSFVTKIEQAERRLDVYEYVQYCHVLQVDPKAGLKIIE